MLVDYSIITNLNNDICFAEVRTIGSYLGGKNVHFIDHIVLVYLMANHRSLDILLIGCYYSWNMISR